MTGFTYASPWLNLPGGTNTLRTNNSVTNYPNTLAGANQAFRDTVGSSVTSRPAGVFGSADSMERQINARRTGQPNYGVAQNVSQTSTNNFDATSGVDWQKKYYDDLKTEGYRSAAATLRSAFEAYGLGSLSSTITGYIMDGKPASEVAVLLRQTPQYKQRFPAMDTLAKNGRAISEGEYIGLETSYSKVLSAAGLNNYFTSPNDYAQYIGKDISVEEFSSRVNTATNFVNNSNPNAIEMFKNYYGINKQDLLKYYLDPAKATPELLKKAEIATTAGAAAAAGLDLGEEYSRNIVDSGAAKNAPEAFANVARTKEELAKLASIEQTGVTTKELVGGALGIDANAAKKVSGLASQERARFSGKSAGTAVTGSNLSGSF